MEYLVLFNWENKIFCDFVYSVEAWNALKKLAPKIEIPRKKHPPLKLTWSQFAKHCEVCSPERAKAFRVAYELELNGTVDLISILNVYKVNS